MTQLQLNDKQVLFVEVPEGVKIVWTNIDWYVECSHVSPGIVSINRSNYKFIATSDDITEEQAFKIVGRSFSHNRNTPLAIENLLSLMHSHNLTGRYAVLINEIKQKA